MTFTRIATGDALTVLRQLPSESINAIVTSPPYWPWPADGVVSAGNGKDRRQPVDELSQILTNQQPSEMLEEV